MNRRRESVWLAEDEVLGVGGCFHFSIRAARSGAGGVKDFMRDLGDSSGLGNFPMWYSYFDADGAVEFLPCSVLPAAPWRCRCRRPRDIMRVGVLLRQVLKWHGQTWPSSFFKHSTGPKPERAQCPTSAHAAQERPAVFDWPPARKPGSQY